MAQYSPDIYLFKVTNGDTRKMSKICSKLAIKTPDMNRFHTLRPLLLPNRRGGMRDLSSACKTD